MIGQNNNKNPKKVLYTGMKVCHQHGNSVKSKLSMFPKLFHVKDFDSILFVK